MGTNINISNIIMDNSEIIIENLEPLRKFGLLKYSNKVSPLSNMLIVYENQMNENNMIMHMGQDNNTMWNSMISNQYTLDYLLSDKIQAFIFIVKKYNDTGISSEQLEAIKFMNNNKI